MCLENITGTFWTKNIHTSWVGVGTTSPHGYAMLPIPFLERMIRSFGKYGDITPGFKLRRMEVFITHATSSVQMIALRH